jgi:Transposase
LMWLFDGDIKRRHLMERDGSGVSALVGVDGFVVCAQLLDESSGEWWLAVEAGDPEGEVGAAYLAKELLRDTYLAPNALEARRRLVAFYEHCARSEVPELERLARTIARWEAPILRWHRTLLTKAATEGPNLVIKNIKRLGFGFRNFDNYRLRLLLRCGALWQHRRVASIRPATTHQRAEPGWEAALACDVSGTLQRADLPALMSVGVRSSPGRVLSREGRPNDLSVVERQSAGGGG